VMMCNHPSNDTTYVKYGSVCVCARTCAHVQCPVGKETSEAKMLTDKSV
jgi:hypothetical protein